MGVKLQKIIERRIISINDLAGSIIAIDGPNIIMSLFNFTRKNSRNNSANVILDRTQRPISHLYGLLYRVNFYYSKKIFPIFCFDGRDSDLKKVKTKDSLNDFLFTQKWYRYAMEQNNRDLAREIGLSKEYMWLNILKESKELLGVMGIPYIDSPASAESQCAQLVKDKVAHFSNSQDFDSLLFGCPFLIQNLSKSLRRKVQGSWQYQKIAPFEIDLYYNLEKLRVNIFQLVDMAVLIGTDYFPGVKSIGPKTALKLIHKHHSLEQILSKERNNFDFSWLDPSLIKKVRKIFLLPDVVKLHPSLQWNTPLDQHVISLMCEEHHLDKNRVLKNLTVLGANFKKCQKFFKNHQFKSLSRQKTLDSNY